MFISRQLYLFRPLFIFILEARALVTPILRLYLDIVIIMDYFKIASAFSSFLLINFKIVLKMDNVILTLACLASEMLGAITVRRWEFRVVTVGIRALGYIGLTSHEQA